MNKCAKCGAENRDKARFCKKCGAAIEKEAVLDGWFCKEGIMAELEKFRGKAQAARNLKNSGAKVRMGLDCLITGPQGCGKKFLVDELVRILVKEKLVSEPKPVVVDASEFSGWAEKLDENLKGMSGGILVITNFHKLIQDEDSSKACELDTLFARMKNNADTMPVVMMTGHYGEMGGHLFEFRFKLNGLNTKALAALTADMLDRRFKLKMSDAAQQKLRAHYEWMVRMGEGITGNGHIALKEAEDLATSMFNRGGSIVEEQDISGEIFIPRTEEEIWADLDGYIGLKEVKDEIHNIINSIRQTKEEEGPEAELKVRDHYIFTGNPGTGKTTIARKFAEILAAVGALPGGQLVEIAGTDLIADIVGGSERNVKEYVDKAMGGVLFIDEAYGLAGNEFGQSAINALVPVLENRKGDFVCIIAGYKREMGDFLKSNSGLKSRFNKSIEFPDYKPDELEQLFYKNCKSAGFSLTDEAASKLHIPMEQMYNRKGDQFGNGRDVRNFFDTAVERRNRRVEALDAEERKAEGKLLTYEDIVGKEATEEVDINDVLKELDSLVGLEGVKRELKLLAATIVQEQRKARHKGVTPVIPVYHYLFLGNPGTGKTTVARMMGKILKSLGVLSSSDVVEVNRDGLISEYQGGTAKKTRDAVMRALGGVLFIDEAYSLVSGPGDNYGRECINTLVPLLLNNKGKFVCIAAGYTREMKAFMNANSGLASRFAKQICFDDYDASQLMEIFRRLVAKNDYVLSPEAEKAAEERFERMYAGRTSNFGNAREVGNFLDSVRDNHNMRLLGLGDDQTEEQGKTITIEDIQLS